MNNNCIHLKQGFGKLKCTKLKKEITWSDCKNCEFKEYKQKVSESERKITKSERNTAKKRKTINKVSKKRVTVSKETYDIVYNESQGKCGLCDATDNLQLHHIYYRSERRDLIDEPSNCIMLCHKDFSVNKCHGKVHKNKKKYKPLLLAIKKRPNI